MSSSLSSFTLNLFSSLFVLLSSLTHFRRRLLPLHVCLLAAKGEEIRFVWCTYCRTLKRPKKKETMTKRQRIELIYYPLFYVRILLRIDGECVFAWIIIEKPINGNHSFFFSYAPIVVRAVVPLSDVSITTLKCKQKVYTLFRYQVTLCDHIIDFEWS